MPNNLKGQHTKKTTSTNHVHLYIFTGAGKDGPKHTVRNKSMGSSNTHTKKQPSRISHIHQKPYKLSQGKRKRTRPKHADKISAMPNSAKTSRTEATHQTRLISLVKQKSTKTNSVQLITNHIHLNPNTQKKKKY